MHRSRQLSTMQLIKKLREEVQAPLNIVKTAVSQAEPAGDYESALAALKKEMTKRGERLVAKSADREAKEGWVIAARSENGQAASLAILNCETDFVAKSAKVMSLATVIGKGIADEADNFVPERDGQAQLSQAQIDSIGVQGIPLKESLTESMSVFGETLRVQRAVVSSISRNHKNKLIGIHCHGGSSPMKDVYLGRMGALLNISANESTTLDQADELAREMVAQNPDSLEEFWSSEKVGDKQNRTVRQWAGTDLEILHWVRLER